MAMCRNPTGGRQSALTADMRTPAPLPAGVDFYAVVVILAFAPENRWVTQSVNDMAHLNHPEVTRQMLRWLGGSAGG